MTDLIKVIAFAAFSLSAAACATIEGAGEDIENAGEAISDAARDND